MSTQPTPVAANPATQTPNPPTHTFAVNLAPVNMAQTLRKYGPDGYRSETVSSFEAGPTILNFHAPIKQGEVILGQTMLDRGGELEGGRFGLPSFLAMLENQSSIPSECRGRVAIVCEDILVDEHGGRCITYAYWYGDTQRWLAHVSGVNSPWDASARLVRLGK